MKIATETKRVRTNIDVTPCVGRVKGPSVFTRWSDHSRLWLLRKIAGKRTVAINLKWKGTIACGEAGGFFANCESCPTLEARNAR